MADADIATAVKGANPIWKFFVKIPPGHEAQCLKCHAILKTPTSTTTTLAMHLKRHPDDLGECEKERCARQRAKCAAVAKPNLQQPSVADRFKPKVKSTTPKAQMMTKAIAGFVVRGMHSYNVVEEPGFLAVMEAAMPEYVVPSRTTFSRTIIPALYALKKRSFMENLQAVIDSGVEAISITTDGWTSRANESYLSVTCHVMDSSFQQHVHALACTEMADAHTAGNLVVFLKSVMKEWALPEPGTVPVYIVTDNGRNFTAAIAQSPWIGIKRFGHTLQLCVSDVKREVHGFSQLCAKARAIVGRYMKSPKARARLMEIQREMKLDVLEVVQDVPTRRNSEHQMTSRLLKLRKPIIVELLECDGVDNLTAPEWKLMTAVVKVLDPLAQATTELSGDKYPTLSQVIPLLECTSIVLARYAAQSDESSAIALSLARSIKARFPGVKTSEETALAMLLDPRFKDACYTARAEKK
ncbi:zinc finger BED domain-containing protein 4-like [Rhipicephalus sanguineus]|uniref:zinc finger BED domain-containing protein 4-like n=1 Tax=Rhipicephalus sanguineus TaxID=34632 RepID=UPI0020C2F3AF|nr:zinc finger BED domain-containing protein 4-like [Rhipicephalus sanguineus]